MKRTERTASAVEIAEKYRDLSFFERRARRIAREEASAGNVVTLTFSVRRVWSWITCSGPPCCPNSWFIETTDSEYLAIDSWHYLDTNAEGFFPGRDVEAALWPISNRVIRVMTSGEPVVISSRPGRFDALPGPVWPLSCVRVGRTAAECAKRHHAAELNGCTRT